MKSRFFIGHREANEGLLPRLELEINRLIAEEQVRYFYVGGYGGFNQIATTAVKRAKKKYPDIMLMLVLPYHPINNTIIKNAFSTCQYVLLTVYYTQYVYTHSLRRCN